MGNNANTTKRMGNKLLILIPDKMVVWKAEYSINEMLIGGIPWLVIVVDLLLESAHGYKTGTYQAPDFLESALPMFWEGS